MSSWKYLIVTTSIRARARGVHLTHNPLRDTVCIKPWQGQPRRAIPLFRSVSRPRAARTPPNTHPSLVKAGASLKETHDRFGYTHLDTTEIQLHTMAIMKRHATTAFERLYRGKGTQ